MSKPLYEKPVISKLASGVANKFGHRLAAPVTESIEGIPIRDLISSHGSPLFVFVESKLRRQYRDLHAAMALRYPKIKLAWSYKTNYLGAVCRVFHDEGAWAEVVSDFEYKRAIALGQHRSEIIYNGPYKSRSSLEEAVSSGTIINIDHYDEMQVLEEIARQKKTSPTVGLRVNLSTGFTPHWDRFGFNFENGQAMTAAERILSRGVLRLAGLHCHIGTFVLEADAYRSAAHKLAELANQIEKELGISLDYLDLGGGFASRNTLHSQYLPGDEVCPSFQEYSSAIVEGLDHFNHNGDRPTLILETGRALVDDAGYLLSSVVATKRLEDGRRAIVLDAGTNLLPTSAWYRHDIFPATTCQGGPEPTAVLGPLCMQIDILRENMMLPPLTKGDLMVVKRVGAYNVSQWTQFITLRPAVVMISPDGKVHVIRKSETIDDVTGREEIPPHLSS